MSRPLRAVLASLFGLSIGIAAWVIGFYVGWLCGHPRPDFYLPWEIADGGWVLLVSWTLGSVAFGSWIGTIIYTSLGESD